MNLRIERERAGDTDALPLAAAELVRIAVDEVRTPAQRPAADCGHGRRARCDVPRLKLISGSAMTRPTVIARIERAIGVLEDHLHIGALPTQRSWRAACVRSSPSKKTEPAVGLISCSTARPSVDLPQPLSPTRPNTSPRLTGQVDTIDRLDRGDRAPEQAAANGEVDFETVNVNERIVLGRFRRSPIAAVGVATASPSESRSSRSVLAAHTERSTPPAGSVRLASSSGSSWRQRRLRLGAAWRERAARRQIDEVRRLPTDGVRRVASRAVGAWHRIAAAPACRDAPGA